MNAVLDHPPGLAPALRNARDFLLGTQDSNGGWRDFLLPAGLSDSWITGYVGAALLSGLEADADAQQAARRGWAFLATTETDQGGWSYNPTVPGDADSTLWGLRFAVALGEDRSDLARRGFAFLERHLRDDGGLSTYATADPIRGYIGAPPFVPFDGWTQSHACVSAAGANLDRLAARIVPYLIATQRDDGSWPAYFWFDREYSTAEAVAALVRQDATRADLSASIGRAIPWLVRRVQVLADQQTKWRPVFALSCAAQALALRPAAEGVRPALALAASRLADWQRGNGSWGPSARLRVPLPDAIVPPENADWSRWEGMPPGATSLADVLKLTFNNYSPDHRGLFTAATALRALHRISEAHSP